MLIAPEYKIMKTEEDRNDAPPVKLSEATWAVWSDLFIGKLMKKKIYRKVMKQPTEMGQQHQQQSSLPPSVTTRARVSTTTVPLPATPLTPAATEQEFEANDVALGLLKEWCGIRYNYLIRGEMNFEKAWECLVNEFGNSRTGADQLRLDIEFSNLAIGENERLSSFIQRVDELAKRIAETGAPRTDQEIGTKALACLATHQQYQSLYDSWSMTAQEVNWQNIKEKITTYSKMKFRPKSNNNNNSRTFPRDKQKEKAMTASVTCDNCHRPGHKKETCWARGGDKEGQYPNKKKELEKTFIAATHPPANQQQWYIDSGATSHMTFNSNCLFNVSPYE